MKRTAVFCLLCAAVMLAIAPMAQASTITWNFGTTVGGSTADPTSSTDPGDWSGGTMSQFNNAGTTSFLLSNSASNATGSYAGNSGQFNAGLSTMTGATVTAASSSAFQFTLTPNSTLNFTAIQFGSRSTGTGPQSFELRSDADSYASALASASLANNSTYILVSPSAFSVSSGAPITFRIYGFGGTANSNNASNWRIDDVQLTYGAVPEPATLVLCGLGMCGVIGAFVRRRKTS